MITSKAQMLKVIATCAQPHTLTREEKFQVFCNVCDNMLAEGRITAAKHKQWTNLFWGVPVCQTVHHFPQSTPMGAILKESKESHFMQLTSQGQSRAMVVEFQPHAILSNKFVYTLKFMGDEQTKSMRLMSKKEMIETINARLDLNYEVTDFLTEPSNYSPACCW